MVRTTSTEAYERTIEQKRTTQFFVSVVKCNPGDLFCFLECKTKEKKPIKSAIVSQHSVGAEESDWRKIQNANCTFTDVLQCVKNGVGT